MSIDFRATGGAFLIGTIFVVLFTWINGNQLGSPTFPMLAMISGYILAGVTIGFLSEGETVLEPVLATILVGIVGSFVIDAMSLNSFRVARESGTFSLLMTLATMNGLVLAFAGAWAGEKLQRTYADAQGAQVLQWGWVTAGTVLGIAVSLLLAALEIRIVGVVTGEPFAAFSEGNIAALYVVLVLGLLATGYLCAFRSVGRTQVEAGVAGTITAVVLLDIFVVALAGLEFLSAGTLVISLLIGVASSLAGGFFGELSQSQAESVGAPTDPAEA